jgi:uncharacterized protein
MSDSAEIMETPGAPSGMNSRRNSLFIVIGVGSIMLIAFLFQWLLTEDTYVADELTWRKARNENFKADAGSPIPDSLKASFDSLDWFPVKRELRITAIFEENPEFQRIEMPRSKSGPETYIIAGWAKFQVDGIECKLTCYQPNPKDSKTLFIPFRDKTTGSTTYSGGRYIDTRRAGNRIPLDFNRAYNPYCVYNYDYACPVPPEENRLQVAIEAGEKDFHWPETTIHLGDTL